MVSRTPTTGMPYFLAWVRNDSVSVSVTCWVAPSGQVDFQDPAQSRVVVDHE